MIYYLRCAEQGRFLEGHGPGKIFGRSANFSHFDRNFYIYYVWLGLTRAFFSARVFRLWHVQRARSTTGAEIGELRHNRWSLCLVLCIG
ncbi:hypothetical protein HanPI659440_Chr13g0511241 [Helianthus annuus]|nr:hypothetical protein HanPI659440_Chr13g0511241 [Helianthus annuus]